jgi:hypothetical protein
MILKIETISNIDHAIVTDFNAINCVLAIQ